MASLDRAFYPEPRCAARRSDFRGDMSPTHPDHACFLRHGHELPRRVQDGALLHCCECSQTFSVYEGVTMGPEEKDADG